jgi:hypothetical protein
MKPGSATASSIAMFRPNKSFDNISTSVSDKIKKIEVRFIMKFEQNKHKK